MTGHGETLDGLHNFRDLGGLGTRDGRWVRGGRVYRSDALHRMTRADVERVRRLALSSIVDLRAPDEIAHVGIGPIRRLDAEYHNLPTRPALFAGSSGEPGASASPAPRSAPERYLGYLGEGPGCFAGVLALLADPARTPLVFFCNAGKDRTGVVAAMVLGLLGVDDEAVAADYARTQGALDAIRLASRRDYPSDVQAWRNLSPDMREARAETMLAFLDLVRERVGGWEAYVATLGLEAGTVERMRDSLLEPEGDPHGQ